MLHNNIILLLLFSVSIIILLFLSVYVASNSLQYFNNTSMGKLTFKIKVLKLSTTIMT